MTFDIRQLRYAIAVADHGSFHRAAEAMEVEQSTLSRNVLKLERLIGVKIFDRSHAGTTLTIAGRQFIRRARPMVACADKLASIMRATRQGHAGSLTIGHNSSISAGNLRGATLGWHNVHPEVDLGGMEADRGALLAGLDTGEIDIAILMGEVSHNGFRRESFWSERVLVALPSNHPLAERAPLALAGRVIHEADEADGWVCQPASRKLEDTGIGKLAAQVKVVLSLQQAGVARRFQTADRSVKHGCTGTIAIVVAERE
jgi:DNA-binding transcriptional LysR family regulator